MGKIAKYKDSKNTYYYVKNSNGDVVDYGILRKGLQVETEQDILKQSTRRSIFNDIFQSGWYIDRGEIIGTLREA
tara:strand:- start:78 stop:302 length:225 start_codon:yes stop_codon:yes gene_type:complete